MKFVIITGLSGSGKSVALHTLEDEGFYCIDNLPGFLLPTLASELANRQDDNFRHTAVGIDARNPTGQLGSITALLAPLKGQGIECEIIFLDAQDDTLIKRFSETRRKHPLTRDNEPLVEAIRKERQLMSPFLAACDLHIDTSHTTLHELRDTLRARISAEERPGISLLFQSFGFKHGVPVDADFVYDVRCLPNPHWQTNLRPLTGRDQPVVDFLAAEPRVGQLQEEICGFLERWIPHFEADGRRYLTFAIGCTGGQHRSVYIAERLAAHFRSAGRQVQLRHRELH